MGLELAKPCVANRFFYFLEYISNITFVQKRNTFIEPIKTHRFCNAVSKTSKRFANLLRNIEIFQYAPANLNIIERYSTFGL